jgi:hypothetical protein
VINDAWLVRRILKSYNRILAHNPPKKKPSLNDFIILALALGLPPIEKKLGLRDAEE